jgi:hypothetical protein
VSRIKSTRCWERCRRLNAEIPNAPANRPMIMPPTVAPTVTGMLVDDLLLALRLIQRQ